MDILYPVIILTGLSIVFAITIAIFSKKLAIIEDERISKISESLAGANCGACGKAGCQDFARALLDGSAKLSDCNVTSKESKEKIMGIIGKDVQIGEETIVVCACRGGNNCEDKYDYQGYGNCGSVELLAGGRKACSTACIGNGDCGDVCGYDAIKIINGHAVVNQNKCVKCGSCISHCPKKVIKRISAKAKYYVACSTCEKGKYVRAACEVGCVGCGICVKNCPSGALSLVDNLPRFDYEKCTDCGICMQKCPFHCIATVDNLISTNSKQAQ